MADRILVTVRLFGAARAAAGVDQEGIAVDGPATVADVLEAAAAAHGPKLADVLRRCSFLLAERAVHSHQTPIGSTDILDVLPPFAGG